MFQQLLISNLSKKQLSNFEIIFSLLPIEEKPFITGRRPYPRLALLNALIYKNLFSIPTFADLSRHLRSNPEIAQLCGLSNFPSKERFSAFIRNAPNNIFQNVRKSLISRLIQFNQISGNFIAADSESISYSSRSFKELFNLRSSVERIFSRLLSICMQDSSVKGLQSFSNICTIAHITILVVALFAVSTGNKNKIRFIKKFFQDA